MQKNDCHTKKNGSSLPACAVNAAIVVLSGLAFGIFAGQHAPAEAASAPGANVGDLRLNDTGITWAGNYPKGNKDDCSANEALSKGEAGSRELVAQQDCTQGLDADVKGRNEAAFVYRKVGAAGELLERDAKDWTCVLDEVTGLAWEVKQPADGTHGNRGLHDADDLFTWYYGIRNGNGGAIGDWGRARDQCAGYQADVPASYCNTAEFVNRVNASGLCGFDGWRVPTRSELLSLVHYGRSVPAIDSDYFVASQNNFYWSLSPTAGQTATAWAVSFEFGFAAPMPRTNAHPVRLVRDWQY